MAGVKISLVSWQICRNFANSVLKVDRVAEKFVFLLGPRGTGKSTWISEHFGDARTYDLLDLAECLRLEPDPHQLGRELELLGPKSWEALGVNRHLLLT
jgi:hypothetical protein